MSAQDPSQLVNREAWSKAAKELALAVRIYAHTNPRDTMLEEKLYEIDRLTRIENLVTKPEGEN